MDKLQKEFEAWLESEFGMWAIQARPGVYGSEQIQDMWKAWQAALSSIESAEPEPLWSADDKLIIRGFIARILAGWDESPSHYRRAIQWLSINRDRDISKAEMDAAYNSIRGDDDE